MSEHHTAPDLATEISLIASLKIAHITVHQDDLLTAPTMFCARCEHTIGTIEHEDTLEGLLQSARVHGGTTCTPGAPGDTNDLDTDAASLPAELRTFAELWGEGPFDGVPGQLQCTELDALAALLRFAGKPEAAELWTAAHAIADDVDDRHHLA